MKFRSITLALAVTVSMTACTSTPTIQTAPKTDTHRRLNPLEVGQPKQIQVFFDGTANDWSARTSVRRRFEYLPQPRILNFLASISKAWEQSRWLAKRSDWG